LIQPIANKVQKNLRKLRKAKYFSITLDCISDVSHQEQLTVILRFAQCDAGENKNIVLTEALLGYFQVSDGLGK